jgi:hypothetical protein
MKKHIAILTFEGFNELDSLIAYGMLSRISLLGDVDWRVSIASPTPRVTSMNGLTIDAHIDLQAANSADAVLIGSGMKTREVGNDASSWDKSSLIRKGSSSYRSAQAHF